MAFFVSYPFACGYDSIICKYLFSGVQQSTNVYSSWKFCILTSWTDVHKGDVVKDSSESETRFLASHSACLMFSMSLIIVNLHILF